jgi:hypothetical protein
MWDRALLSSPRAGSSLRRVLLNVVTLLTVFVSMPGALEMARDVGHWVSQGHTIHAPGDAEDQHGQDSEHGCSGMFHVCHCCGHVQVLQRSLSLQIGAAAMLAVAPQSTPDDGILPGYRAPPFRPPSA